MKKNRNKKKSPVTQFVTGFLYGIVILCVIICVFTISSLFSSDSESTTASNDSTSEQNSDTQQEQVVYEDDYVKCEYLGIQESDYLPGNIMINFKYTNKSSQEYTVYPENSYVNDSMAQFFAGMTNSIQPGKEYIQTYTHAMSDIGISSIDEVTKIGLSLWIVDANMNDIERTPVFEFNTK